MLDAFFLKKKTTTVVLANSEQNNVILTAIFKNYFDCVLGLPLLSLSLTIWDHSRLATAHLKIALKDWKAEFP